MHKAHIVLLPGLDGTGRLFQRFTAALPPEMSVTCIALPSAILSYDDLADHVVRSLSIGGPLVAIAESFSGPIALAIAQRHPVAALVFCNSFIDAPRSRILRRFVNAPLFELPVPHWFLRRYLIGSSADEALVDEVANVIASVPARVLASRLRSVLTTDEAGAFARCPVPTLYVRGTDDRLVPDSAWRRMAAIRPMAIARVPGPHLLLQANPIGAWDAIAPFLESLRSA